MKKLITICAVVTMILAVSNASADFSWQTTPILGTDVSDATGNVVVITGPTPINPDPLGDGFYYDESGYLVLGPTIPNYSQVGDPLFGVGSPSMTLFTINPDTYVNGHWTDMVAAIYSGSGVNLEAGHTYHYTGIYTYISPNPSYSVIAAENADFSGDVGFIILTTGISELWLEDIGRWNYTETWIDLGTQESISYSADFQVIPEPATMSLLGLGVLSLLRRKK